MVHFDEILLTEFVSQIFQKTNNVDENHKIINKNIKIVNLEILKEKAWFGGLAIRICKLINLLSKTDDFIKNDKFS